jgi:hypothetical protein
MFKPGGYLEINDPDPAKGLGQKAKQEYDTVTCGHNGEIVKVPANCPAHALPYAMCWGCRRYICLKCDAELSRTLKCDVIEKKLERMEARDRFRDSL